jgi:hypothetical protein
MSNETAYGMCATLIISISSTFTRTTVSTANIEGKRKQRAFVAAQIFTIKPSLCVLVGALKMNPNIVKAGQSCAVEGAPVPNDAVVSGKRQFQRTRHVDIDCIVNRTAAKPAVGFPAIFGIFGDLPFARQIDGSRRSRIQTEIKRQGGAEFR